MKERDKDFMETLKDRVAVVTGGTRGIGLGISLALARAGAKVAAVYRADRKAAERTLEQLGAVSADTVVVQADISGRVEAQRCVQTVVDKWGRVDILVNNAGIFDFRFLDEMTDEFFDAIYATNLKGVILMMQAVIPHMKKGRFGRIINASSISGRFADVGLIAYACAKAGVDMTTRIASAELAPHGITVNAFAPGIIDTDMTHSMIEERGHLQVKQIPAGYFGRPDDVAGLVVFLSSDSARYITGEIIGVDGGMMKVQNPYRAAERSSP